MYRKLAVVAVLAALLAGSVTQTAYGRGTPSSIRMDRPATPYDSPGDDTFFDVYARGGLTDTGADGLYDSPGDDTLVDPESGEVFFPTRWDMIDDPRVIAEAFWLELLMGY